MVIHKGCLSFSQLKVWQGALLLCDFILEHQKEFVDATALELGGGVGLASVVMATIARKVICTG